MMCVVTLIGSENTVRCYLSVLDHFSPHIREDTLGSVLSRAGSLTDLAFSKGAVFTRVSLQERERQHLEDLASVLEASLARSSTNKIQDPEEFEAITAAQQREDRRIGRDCTNRLHVWRGTHPKWVTADTQIRDNRRAPTRRRGATSAGARLRFETPNPVGANRRAMPGRRRWYRIGS